MPDRLHYDPYDAATREDPYPLYRRLRDEAPAYFIEKYGAWAISRFEDIWQLSNDTRRLSNARGIAPAQLLTRDQPVDPVLPTTDPPEHTALRGAVRGNFLPRKVRELEVHARALCQHLLEEARPTGQMDVVRDFASRLSVTVVCHALGLPVEDGPKLTEYVQGFFSHDPDTGGMSAEGLASLGELNDYCVERIRERRRGAGGQDGPLGALASFEFEGRPYSDEDAGSHLGNLIIGGSETFPKLLASALVRLAEYPHFREDLRERPAGISDAFDEVLRYDMPTQFLGRSIVEEIELHGQRLEAGQALIFLYPSANRDEREFVEPDVFDIRRRAPRMLSFGTGPHQCIGRHVARMEGRVAHETLLPALGDYEIEFDRVLRLRTEFVQGYGSLPIRFDASS